MLYIDTHATIKKFISVGFDELKAEAITDEIQNMVRLSTANLSTKQDIKQSEYNTKQVIDISKADYKKDTDEFNFTIRQAFSEFRAEMKKDLAEFNAEIRREFSEFKAEMKQDVSRLDIKIDKVAAEIKYDILKLLIPLIIGSQGLSIMIIKYMLGK